MPSTKPTGKPPTSLRGNSPRGRYPDPAGRQASIRRLPGVSDAHARCLSGYRGLAGCEIASATGGIERRTRERGFIPRCFGAGEARDSLDPHPGDRSPVEERPHWSRGRTRRSQRRVRKARAPENDRRDDARASAPPPEPRICSWGGLEWRRCRLWRYPGSGA